MHFQWTVIMSSGEENYLARTPVLKTDITEFLTKQVSMLISCPEYPLNQTKKDW